MDIKINFNDNKLDIEEVGLADSLWLKFRGLMFRNVKNSPRLLFNGRFAIHSYFVFFPFLTLWLDSENNVVDYKIVKPFKTYVNSSKKFSKILEIPLNKGNKNIVDSVVGKTFKKK